MSWLETLGPTCTDLRMCLAACSFFFFNDTATTEIYTLSLHDALPISVKEPFTWPNSSDSSRLSGSAPQFSEKNPPSERRSEEHTSELQSLAYLVCRLLLEKKKRCGRMLADLRHAPPRPRVLCRRGLEQ